ncbi:VOC family protein [Actinoplanes sp. NPDC049548]|uniref:VOC family protein n=1 Tax=Actinoplanes sp. NPDC049548 TaxID=3155152 RepID=UPI0034187153
MTTRLGSVVINCSDLEALTRFWSAALGLVAGPGNDDGTFRVLRGPSVNLSLQVARTPVTARDQMHFDLYTDDQSGEVERMRALGAVFVRHNADPDDDYVVMADPEGNLFCLCARASVE